MLRWKQVKVNILFMDVFQDYVKSNNSRGSTKISNEILIQIILDVDCYQGYS
jgi:hypothetical protein